MTIFNWETLMHKQAMQQFAGINRAMSDRLKFCFTEIQLLQY